MSGSEKPYRQCSSIFCKKGDCDRCYDQRMNEPASSPLESVVQGRPESPVPSNPAVQGTPDILAEIRARASKAREDGLEEMAKYPYQTIFHYGQYCYAHAFREMLQWLDELAEPNDNTAPNTK